MDLTLILGQLGRLVIGLLIAIVFVIGSALVLSWGDRKMLAYTQDRFGPLHSGPRWLQGLPFAIADTLKLLLKEDVVPGEADKILHLLAPVMFVMPMLGAYVALPLANQFPVAADLNVGLIFVVAVSSLSTLGVLTAGWSSNNKYSTLGGLRAVAQNISYEVPLVLSLVPAAMMAGTLSLSGIVSAQVSTVWFGLLLPLAALIFFICGLAETNRNPFDLPEAENELVAGYLTEFSGIRWAMFFMAEYGNMVVICWMAATLFLGGWHGPFGEGFGWLWTMAKLYAVMFVFLWVRATLPRLRIDQLMGFAWKVLIPLALVNIGLVGTLAVLVPGTIPVALPLGITVWQFTLPVYALPLAAVNWAMLAIFVWKLPSLVLLRPATKPESARAVKQTVVVGNPLADAAGR
ncbi:MAG: NADH-quinone oxidoreductase subunit NuoH [Chloroflexi bacterium]|nr:NADH-quinone oxidoreductase subunit NuoH [Chloroflexota bacterium]